MYCYTKINNIVCVFNELELWSDISSEHPIFIKTVADLTNKKLPSQLVEKLMKINKMFVSLKKETTDYKNSNIKNPKITQAYLQQLTYLIDKFLKYDEYVLSVLPEVKQYGKGDKVWQTLLDHIEHEQRFMYNLFTDLRVQLGR